MRRRLFLQHYQELLANIIPINLLKEQKQGFELAKSLSKKGFETTLISGPTNLKAGENINFIKVETADEMFKATQNNLPVDVAIFSAAVADFKIKERT